MNEEKSTQNFNFSKTGGNDNSLDMSNQLNSTMSITPSAPDEFTKKIANIGGSN